MLEVGNYVDILQASDNNIIEINVYFVFLHILLLL